MQCCLQVKPFLLCFIAIDAMEFLQLKYKVDWPCNIVITNASIEKYNKVNLYKSCSYCKTNFCDQRSTRVCEVVKNRTCNSIDTHC